MSTTTEAREASIVVHNLSWRTYGRLLADFDGHAGPRLTFDKGTLEIMSPTAEHEEYNRTISLLIEVAAEELGMDVRNVGSATFKREDLLRGFEADSAFYIGSAARIAGKTRIDLRVDPPPDLVVEIDITRNSLDKLPVYSIMGVSELWRYDGRKFEILTLVGDSYVDSANSLALPPIAAAAISSLVELSKSTKRTGWLRELRQYVKTIKPD